MEQRPIERLGRSVSCVGFGAWQLGADWGDVSEGDATAALEEGEDHGLRMYRDALKEADLGDAAYRTFVSTVLLPAEQKSHDACRSLKRFAKAAAI